MLIDLPFASALNPHVRVLEQHLDTLAARGAEGASADRDRWRSARFERLAARMYPDAPLPLLTISVEALGWVFDYDDYLADVPTESEQDATRQLAWSTARILAGEVTSRPAPPMGPLWDVCAKARTIGDSAWSFRFRRDVQDFADRMYEEACSRADRQPPAPVSVASDTKQIPAGCATGKALAGPGPRSPARSAAPPRSSRPAADRRARGRRVAG